MAPTSKAYKVGSGFTLNRNLTPREPTRPSQQQTQLHAQNQQQRQHEVEQPTPSSTPSEKTWLKESFGSEYYFLRDYGLSIYKEDHREEGRAIARGLMELDNVDDNANDDNEAEEEKESPILGYLDTEPGPHNAGYHISAEELDGVQEHYDHSGEFLMNDQPTFYDDGRNLHSAGEHVSAEQSDWIQEHDDHSGDFMTNDESEFYDDGYCQEDTEVAADYVEYDEDWY